MPAGCNDVCASAATAAPRVQDVTFGETERTALVGDALEFRRVTLMYGRMRVGSCRSLCKLEAMEDHCKHGTPSLVTVEAILLHLAFLM